MTFKEKIHTILKTNKLGLTSVEDIAGKTGIKVGTIYKAMGPQNGMGLKLTRKLLDGIGIHTEWWESGKGDIYITSVPDEPPLTKKDPASEENRILIRNLDRMGEVNEFLLRELKTYKERFGDL